MPLVAKARLVKSSSLWVNGIARFGVPFEPKSVRFWGLIGFDLHYVLAISLVMEDLVSYIGSGIRDEAGR